MPLYEYECDACGHRFEVIQKFSDPHVKVCPKCGGSVQKLLSSPAIQFKGSGFYLTDYGRGGKSDTAPSAKGGKSDSGESSSSKASDSGSSGSSDSGSKSESGAKSDSGSKSDGGSKSEGSTKSESTTKTESKPAASTPAKSD